jgi:prefoldin alpha subunit
MRSITDGVTGSKDKGTEGREEILVPLTSSLYVKGRLTDREKVLVDVGTGFYIEKTAPKAIAFYEDKVKGLDANLQELEKIVSGKSQQLRVVEEGESFFLTMFFLFLFLVIFLFPGIVTN